MTPFELFLRLGIGHITDIKGYDHIVFLIALCTTLTFKDWRRLLLIITLFTLGHTLTLMLAAFELITVHGPTVEFLIALTIFFTGLTVPKAFAT